MNKDFECYKMRLESLLSQKRFEHSVSVAFMAKRMAEFWGVDVYKAEIAGLLHDVAKNMEYDELERFCFLHGIPIGDAPSLLHAPAGAVLLHEEWGIDDVEILAAVASHTVAQAGMSELQRIIYLADVAEEYRNFEGVEEVRRLIFEDLDKAMFYSLKENLNDLEKHGKYIAPQSRAALKYYQEICRRKDDLLDRKNNFQEELKLIIIAAKEKNAEEIIAMNLEGLTVVSDSFVIMSASNARQVQAIAENIIDKLALKGINALHFEGYREGTWILIDFGFVMVHIFQPEERKYYNLERLWGDAPVVQY